MQYQTATLYSLAYILIFFSLQDPVHLKEGNWQLQLKQGQDSQN